MNPPKCDELDYIHFLIASQRVFTRRQPDTQEQPRMLPPPACSQDSLPTALRAFLRLEVYRYAVG